MIRSVAIITVVFALLAPQVHSDEGKGRLRFFDLILILESWPPQGEPAALIRGKLEAAGFEERDRFESARAWIFRPRVSTGPGISELCAELMRDERTRTLIEGCFPDRLIFPPRPVLPRQ